MTRVINVVFQEHDLLFVGLAAFVCAFSALATFNVLERARAAGQGRIAWLMASAATAGGGIWATHFIAMLGFQQHLSASYDIPLTAFSALAGIGIMGVGLAMPFLLGTGGAILLASGAVVGLGVGALHYLGMAAYHVSAAVSWDMSYVAASVLTGALFAAIALRVAFAVPQSSLTRRAVAAGLLVLGVVALHFTGMAAMDVSAHGHEAADADGSSTGWLALSVAFVGILLGAVAFVTAMLDQRLTRQAEQAEARLIGAVEAMSDGFVLYDSDDRLVMCNEAFRAMHEQVRDAVVPGRTFEEITRAAAASGLWADAIGREEEWIAERIALRRECERTQLIRLSDGRWIMQRDRRTPAGEMVGIRTDVTGLKEREVELGEAREKAILAERAKSEFLANMSHEIRTPMNGVMGMAELLAKTELDAKQRTFTDIIVKSGDALLTIINDILDFSKIDAGQLELDPQPFKLAEAVEDVATLVSAKVEEKELELAVRIQPDLPDMYVGDAGRLRQIITNLVGNAVKFTEAGHVLIDVSGSVQGRAAELVVKVTDTGIGIPADKIASVFEKFSQVDGSSTRQHEGTGLGLTISKLLVEKMEGQIGVESEVGKGSTFWFAVPLPVHGEARPSKSVPGDMSGARILIVDDNEVNRSILIEQLDSWRFEAAAASSGREALTALRSAAANRRPWELVILDYHMPGMDGLQVAKAMRADAALKATPIVMLTSVDQPGDAKTFRSFGIEACLVKPARSSLLLDTLVSTLHEARQAQAAAAAEPRAGKGRGREAGAPGTCEEPGREPAAKAPPLWC